MIGTGLPGIEPNALDEDLECHVLRAWRRPGRRRRSRL